MMHFLELYNYIHILGKRLGRKTTSCKWDHFPVCIDRSGGVHITLPYVHSPLGIGCSRWCASYHCQVFVSPPDHCQCTTWFYGSCIVCVGYIQLCVLVGGGLLVCWSCLVSRNGGWSNPVCSTVCMCWLWHMHPKLILKCVTTYAVLTAESS